MSNKNLWAIFYLQTDGATYSTDNFLAVFETEKEAQSGLDKYLNKAKEITETAARLKIEADYIEYYDYLTKELGHPLEDIPDTRKERYSIYKVTIGKFIDGIKVD